MSKQNSSAIKVKWDHFGIKHHLTVKSYEEEDVWKEFHAIDPGFDGQLSYIDENGKKLKFGVSGGTTEFIAKYVQLQPKYARVRSESDIAININEGSTFMVSTREIENSIVASNEQVISSASDPKLVTVVNQEMSNSANGCAVIPKEKDEEQKKSIQGRCHFAIVDKTKDRPLFGVKEYPFQYAGFLREGFFKILFWKVVDGVREVVFEHWVEEDCKLENSPNMKRVVYLASNCLSNTMHTISVIFEKQEQLKDYICFVHEGVCRARTDHQWKI